MSGHLGELACVEYGPSVTRPGLDHHARTALTASNLAGLPEDVIGELTQGAVRRRIPARTIVHAEAEDAPHLELVVGGLVRVHVSASDGRTMTVRYCRPGALLGVATLYAPVRRPFAIQALTDSEVLSLRPALVRALADRDAKVARALLAETSERVMSFVAELSGDAFASVPQRIARHLLDLASDRRSPDALTAPISQQELADAAGTVREVVVRILRDFRQRGAVETGRSGIVICDPEYLARLGSPGWNESS
jgi:CRP/FNR family transcriptional regulator, cyclic AMP receptor protein